eukprot:3695021-Rhodomonas_salina.1
MLWHQILTDWYTKDGEEMREHKSAMVRAEKRGYCTISWVAMHHLTTSLGLTHSMGELLFGTYPGLMPLWKHSEAGLTSVQQRSNWLLLSAVPQDDMEQWLVTLIERGGGVVASTTLLNMLNEVSHRLRTLSLAYGQVCKPAAIRHSAAPNLQFGLGWST